jgi:hypothetical protein
VEHQSRLQASLSLSWMRPKAHGATSRAVVHYNGGSNRFYLCGRHSQHRSDDAGLSADNLCPARDGNVTPARKGITRKGLYPGFTNSTVLPEVQFAHPALAFCDSQQHMISILLKGRTRWCCKPARAHRRLSIPLLLISTSCMKL